MDGLEAVEIKLSEAVNEILNYRFDSEYYQKKFVENEKILHQNKCDPFEDYTFFIRKGIFDLPPENYVEKGIPLIRTTEIKKPLIDFSGTVFITEEINTDNCKTSLKPFDIVFTKIGAYIGDVALLPENFSTYNISQNVAGASIKNNQLSPYLLFFLISKYGRNQLLRSMMLSGQGKLDLSQIKQLKIIKPSTSIVEKCRNILNLITKFIDKAKDYYQQAEDLLLSELNLKDWQPTKETIAIKSFKESFLSSSRLDAEYYQPKYDELEEKFKEFKILKISQFINYPVSSGATPKAGGDDYTDAESGIPFIRAVDLKDGRVDTSNFIYIKQDVHNLTLRKTKIKKDDVLFSIAGTVGRSAIFDHDFEANINQAVSILRFEEKQIKRLYLIVLFNSSVGKIYTSKYSRQGVQTNLNLNEVSNLEIPILDWNIQEKISQKVQESFDLKQKSKQLLEIAKIGVERAIETDEQTATIWINQQLERLGINLTKSRIKS
jgi:restriction endonuclease S subunit